MNELQSKASHQKKHDCESLLKFLENLGISLTTVRHEPLFTVEQSKDLRGQLPGGHCKNLFLKDKKDNFFLVVTLEDDPVDLKNLHKLLGCQRLSFANSERMASLLGVTPGSVTPFAAINDHQGRVTVVLDEKMMEYEQLNYHPLINDATTKIAKADLLKFLKACDHDPLIQSVTKSSEPL